MEESIIQRLLADSSVTAFVSTRVFPGSRPQGSSLPCVVLNRVSGGPQYSDEGETGLNEARIQLDCWAETYSEAKLLARAVTESLSALDGIVGATTFAYIMLDDERDLRESGGNAAEYLFRTGLDFSVWTLTQGD